jgi:hypothetical protein
MMSDESSTSFIILHARCGLSDLERQSRLGDFFEIIAKCTNEIGAELV